MEVLIKCLDVGDSISHYNLIHVILNCSSKRRIKAKAITDARLHLNPKVNNTGLWHVDRDVKNQAIFQSPLRNVISVMQEFLLPSIFGFISSTMRDRDIVHGMEANIQA